MTGSPENGILEHGVFLLGMLLQHPDHGILLCQPGLQILQPADVANKRGIMLRKTHSCHDAQDASCAKPTRCHLAET